MEIVSELGSDIVLLESVILHAKRTCEHLDRNSGIRSRFWTRPQQRSAQDSVMYFVDLLCHLRVVHCFCSLQSKQFHHIADLQAASPLANVNALLQECINSERGREKLQLELAECSHAESDMVDPLDKYMESLEVPEAVAVNLGEVKIKEGQKEKRDIGSEMGGTALSKVAKCQKVHLTAEAAGAEKRAAASALLAEEGKARKFEQENASFHNGGKHLHLYTWKGRLRIPGRRNHQKKSHADSAWYRNPVCHGMPPNQLEGLKIFKA